MTRARLLPCPECERHVRVDEDACPFCRTELPLWFRETSLPPTPATRLSRAALHALRVGALSVTAAACGTGGPVTQPPYGGPFPPEDSGPPADSAQPADTGQPADSGQGDATANDSSSSQDAGVANDGPSSPQDSGNTNDGNSSGQDSGNARDGAPPADAFVNATLGGSIQTCGMTTGPAVSIGAATGKQPTTVADGNPQMGFNVDVSCTVSSNGSGFDLKLSATQEGMNGGTLTIVTVPGKPVSAQGGSGLSGSFSTSNGSFQDSNCTLSFTYNGEAVPLSPPISPGTIFGHISCPNAQSTSGTMQMLMDGASITQTCDGEADFFFTNCGQ